uniref:SH2 domain-containing protein n=1 Tax=Cyprinus carpio TaxID=7962 RepID=A0A8C2J158_CYPCA
MKSFILLWTFTLLFIWQSMGLSQASRPPRRRAPVAPTEDQLRREMWYHGRMSRRDAENLLGRDGDFLVRDSATNPGQYVLTGMQCGLPKHLLLVDPEGVRNNYYLKMLLFV